MATQGMFVVIEKEGDKSKVLYKVVCGCDGMMEGLEKLSAEFKDLVTKGKWKLREIPLKDLYCVAGRHIGCKRCLVVMDGEGIHYSGDEDNDINEWYRKTFDNPSFNPRWESGLVGNSVTLVSDGKAFLS